MADEPGADKAKTEPTEGEPRIRAERSFDPRYVQGNLAGRLFPGPSRRMSRQAAEHIEGLLKPLDGEALAEAWHGRRSGGAADSTRRSRLALDDRAPSAKAPAASADDIAKFLETLDEQNELLRAILASTVDTQTDARATAQNSRTFAWAGTVIALLTLVATVLSIIAAVNAG